LFLILNDFIETTTLIFGLKLYNSIEIAYTFQESISYTS